MAKIKLSQKLDGQKSIFSKYKKTFNNLLESLAGLYRWSGAKRTHSMGIFNFLYHYNGR
jgi:hypothetical protein